jgi:cyclopropane-fatty-acyl-phospholipid synthase
MGQADAVKHAIIKIRDFHFFPRIVFDGEIGLGEAYMAGEWDSPDLEGALKQLIENRDRFSDGNLLLSVLTRVQEKLAHDRRKNTIKNTPDNIAAHYDLSNRMYALFLDQRMLYSCGLFLQDDDTLEIAQENKMNRILKQADVHQENHILEIGCGWGGFAVFAAKQTGCRVTGITVSRAQYNRARQRVKHEGLEDQITILLQDYRHTRGSFDRIVSIEMIEAVGPQFFGQYFTQCKNLLKPGGRMVFQAIVIADERYDQYCKERDWIQKHIFPGGHLPCIKILAQTIHDHTDFSVTDMYHMGPHYATTLSHWRKRFAEHSDDIIAMGFDKVFYRKWIYYFSICEAGFRTSGIDDIQVTLQR